MTHSNAVETDHIITLYIYILYPCATVQRSALSFPNQTTTAEFGQEIPGESVEVHPTEELEMQLDVKV